MPNIILDTRGNEKYSVCDFHRIILPYKRKLTINPKHNIFVFNGVPTRGKPGFLALKQLGFKLVMDLDDSLIIPEGHMLEGLFENQIRDDLKWFLERSDLVTTTTPALKVELSQYNDNVHIVPNGLPFDEGQFVLTKDRYSKSPLVWAGSETHKHDLAILPDFGKDLTLCGFRRDHEELSSAQWLQIKEDIQPGCVYEGIRPYECYMEAYDGHQISIAPLVNNHFNNAKSNLKILEAGAKGLPLVCSPRENYYTEEFKDLIFFADSVKEWKDIVEYLIESPDVCIEKGLALAKYVRDNYNIDDLNETRKLLIEDL